MSEEHQAGDGHEPDAVDDRRAGGAAGARLVGGTDGVAHEHGGGLAHAERHHEGERREVDRDLVRRDGNGAEASHHEAHGAEGGELERGLDADGQAEPEHAPERCQLERLAAQGPQRGPEFAPGEAPAA